MGPIPVGEPVVLAPLIVRRSQICYSSGSSRYYLQTPAHNGQQLTKADVEQHGMYPKPPSFLDQYIGGVKAPKDGK
jgi:hypothetical protein